MFTNDDLLTVLQHLVAIAAIPMQITSRADGVELSHGRAVVQASMVMLHAYDEEIEQGEEEWSAIRLTCARQQATLFLHSDTEDELQATTARVIALASKLPAMMASKIFPCRWCALPVSDETTGHVDQARVDCLACQIDKALSLEFITHALATD